MIIESVNRALDTLSYLAEHQQVGVRELARFLQVNEATAYRILNTLEKKLFVYQEPDSKKYRLGIETLRVAQGFMENQNLSQVAKPYLIELNQAANETICLLIRQEAFGMYIDKIESDHTLIVRAEIGKKTPIFIGGAGKAIFAFLSPEEQDRLIKQYGYLLEDFQIPLDSLIKEYDDIRRQGYATSYEEMDLGVVAVGCPIYDYNKKVVASISIPLPKHRATNEHLNHLIQLLKEY
ncbi:MAG: IclR family transcriptional regulator, partial [Clostridia bacterium]|nr:IclR family transcriptional regulator [Clostridia bacterium]